MVTESKIGALSAAAIAGDPLLLRPGILPEVLLDRSLSAIVTEKRQKTCPLEAADVADVAESVTLVFRDVPPIDAVAVPAPKWVEVNSSNESVEEKPSNASVEENPSSAFVEEKPSNASVEDNPSNASVEEVPSNALVEVNPSVEESLEPSPELSPRHCGLSLLSREHVSPKAANSGQA